MEFSESNDFKKEFKKLKKKYLSLDDDLDNFQQVVNKFPKGSHSRHWNILKEKEIFFIIKARMMCRYLKKSDLRVVYLYNEVNSEIVFIEIYFKGDKENEDRERIKEYLKNLKTN